MQHFRKLIFSAFAATLIVFMGCVEKPEREVAEAEAAVQSARAVEAPTYAPTEFRSAEDMLARTYVEMDQRQYEQARESAVATRDLAEIARAEALRRRQAGETPGAGNGAAAGELRDSGNPLAAERTYSSSEVNDQITAQRTGSGALDEGATVSSMQPILFEFDSFALSEEAKQALDGYARWLIERPSVRIKIEGHTDERGTAEYNLALGDRRAKAAQSYLKLLGVSLDRMNIVSFGEESPADPGHDEDAWSKNRRAVFVVVQ